MIVGERHGRWASSNPPIWWKPKHKPRQPWQPFYFAPMRYENSAAVADAYGAISTCLSMKQQCVCFDSADKAGIVFG